MRKFTALIIVVLASASSSVYAAQNDLYVGLGISSLTANVDLGAGGKEDYRSVGSDLRVGLSLSDNLAVEGRLGAGGSASKDFATEGNTTFKSKASIDYFLSLYAVGKYPLGDFTPYAQIGLTAASTKFEYTENGPTFNAEGVEKKTTTNVSFGLGVDYSINKSLAVGAEYGRLLDQSGSLIKKTTVDALSISAKYKF